MGDAIVKVNLVNFFTIGLMGFIFVFVAMMLISKFAPNFVPSASGPSGVTQ